MSRLISDEVLASLNIWMEARGESYDGKLAVAEVMQNRVRLSFNCDGTVVDMILRPFQFSGWNTNDPNRIAAMRLDDADGMLAMCRQAWRDVLAGSTVVGPKAVFYYNPAGVTKSPPWATPETFLGAIGAHRFYAG